jgi:glycosyltransferase involved in cell wall biosynthesis
MTRPTLSIIIPYFNESRRTDRNVNLLTKFLSAHPEYEVIYVNDGSEDGTEALLHSWYKTEKVISQIKFVANPENLGKGGAIQNGVNHATGEYIMFTDFDFSISLDEIARFLVEMKKIKRGAVIASRKELSVVLQKRSFLRQLMGTIFNKVMKIIVYLPLKDTQCGFKMFDHDTAKKVFPLLKTHGFAFDVEVLKRIHRLNLPILERGVEITNDDKYSTVNIYLDPFKMIWQLLKLRWRLFFE